MDLGLKGKRVLVSGGSRGIGRAIVELFLEEGAQVSFCARGGDGVRTAEQAMSGQARGSVVDVQDASQVAQWVADSAKLMGGIDIVIPNVSALAGGGTIESWRQAFEVDILGSVNLVNASLSYLEASDAPSVVLISSVSGREIDRFAEPYGVLKAALTHYGKTLSAQHAKSGIRVNTVAPGNVYFPGGVWGDIERHDPSSFAECLAANPFGRMARPDEVAKATVFLASPAASFITGTTLLVDGGLSRGVQF
ncbi:SDR family NAD(P)-dependent oxidoreductase [Pseudomonas aeruginosa]|uniref:SDR family NAD(P)-dependent oxidoreductase n=1 Tax=Pseudomonas aeruginosa TaxID=287 RepID=UPI000D6DE81D|nr:SDR family oxidoreductase [Pseudomonas aeruginosa]EKV6491940.1 SDR family oxidoreductase [Pseudomonas aeruginosa]HCF0735632.1 SDR family oxidoreductase [Pseudomonas aeruginosa]HEK0819142.1 SDR family oxidoreductase [Pseudomonas aeruginosa]HEK3702607.1 SDR family oxidoreductase [Pseudomonas aeruginosa]